MRAAVATLGWLTLCAGPALTQEVTAEPTEVDFPISEALILHADVYRAAMPVDAPVILLFHQGDGDARGEYREIAPRLLREGYHVIAADARGGGDRFGGPNRAGTPREDFSYCQALAEVSHTVDLARAQGFTGPIVLWGSSYTAALVVQVGALRAADVRAVLAFSPASGEPMAGCEPQPYFGWLARAGTPTLVLRPRREVHVPIIAAQLDSAGAAGAQTFIAENGVHGSSMLSPSRVEGSTEPQWNAVLAFLRTALAPRAPDPADQRVTIENEGWRLIGDLRRPGGNAATGAGAGPTPLVLLLNKAAGDRRVYRDLAAALAQRGVASLRVDLRGHGESVNRGRFVPGQGSGVLTAPQDDVVALQRFARALPGIDTARIAIVGASYSAEGMAIAGRTHRYERAYVALSPGDFSDESFQAIPASGAAWLIVRADRERFVGERVDEKARRFAPGTPLWVLPVGAAHASDLLLADGGLAVRLADWLTERLREG